MVGSDESVVGPEPASFKESMKREDTTGIMIRLALWDTSQSLKSMFGNSGKGDLHPEEGWKYILNTRPMSTPSDVSYATYHGEKTEHLVQKLTEKHDYKVSRRVSQNRVHNARDSRVSAPARSSGCEENDCECKGIYGTTT